jgi:hypothetical protein
MSVALVDLGGVSRDGEADARPCERLEPLASKLAGIRNRDDHLAPSPSGERVAQAVARARLYVTDSGQVESQRRRSVRLPCRVSKEVLDLIDGDALTERVCAELEGDGHDVVSGTRAC